MRLANEVAISSCFREIIGHFTLKQKVSNQGSECGFCGDSYSLTISWVTVSTQTWNMDNFEDTPLITVFPAVT